MLPKKRIRADVLKKRNGIPPHTKRLKDSAIGKRLFSLKEFKDAKSILFYASVRSEVDTLDMIRKAISMGKSVMLPKVDIKSHSLKIYEVKGMDEIEMGYMGIPEPIVSKKSLRSPDSADIVIMPGIAFDPSGGRLGYGKGYYDRMLSGRHGILKTALAYEEQIVRNIPTELYDIKVDSIITEKRTIWTKKRLKKE